jgi:hypothetical protein
MKQSLVMKSRILATAFILAGLGTYAQKQTKTYKEEFKVEPGAVLDINTSYADIQFETWEKDEVVVEASIEIEGATKEEAEAYFKKSGISILGNSGTIEIKTYGNNSWTFRRGLWPEDPASPMPMLAPYPDMERLFSDLRIPEMPPMPELPPLPPIPNVDFDYQAYQKDGEKYLKKWKKEFNKNFDKEYQEDMEAWGREFAARAEAKRDLMEEQREALESQRDQLRQQKEEIMQRAMEDRERAMEQSREARERAREARELARETVKGLREKGLFELNTTEGPNIFYRSEDGSPKNFKVKKTIKIKMPKSATLKMNVRHGEVKLAANTRNINATLSYARLQAASIEGEKTKINASYSPVKVAQWKYGFLNTSFSDGVELDAVTELKLVSTSSEVTINKILKKLASENNLGALTISAVDPGFTSLDIVVQNGELRCTLPATPFSITANNTYSEFAYPASWTLNKLKNGQKNTYTGISMNGGGNRSLTLNTSYSNIILQ